MCSSQRERGEEIVRAIWVHCTAAAAAVAAAAVAAIADALPLPKLECFCFTALGTSNEIVFNNHI